MKYILNACGKVVERMWNGLRMSVKYVWGYNGTSVDMSWAWDDYGMAMR